MNCSLFCHSGILFCNLFCGPWQVENEPWFSLLSCMLIVRPTVQLFPCRTEGPDPVFGEGREPGCVIFCCWFNCDKKEILFLFPHFPASWVNVKGQITLCNLLPKYIMAVQRCVASLMGHGRGCVVGVLRAKVVKREMLERIYCLGYKSAFCLNEVMKYSLVRNCP